MVSVGGFCVCWWFGGLLADVWFVLLVWLVGVLLLVGWLRCILDLVGWVLQLAKFGLLVCFGLFDGYCHPARFLGFRVSG